MLKMPKSKKALVSVIVLAVILGIGSVLFYKKISAPRQTVTNIEGQTPAAESFAPLDKNIKVAVALSKLKANTVVITVSGLGGKVVSVAYELTYQSGGLIKGVNSGSKPLDVSGQDSFTREVYLGTCSKNDCKPDLGVTKVSVVLEFTNTDGQKSQFSGDFDLTGAATSGSQPAVTPGPVSD